MRSSGRSRRPSYRDVIQNAAVVAVIQHPDSGLVDALARQVGGQPLPSVALAVLASRGDSTAVAALGRVLDDERGWVRGMALEAVTGQLEAADASGLLRAVLPNLRRDDARAEVQAAVAGLDGTQGN